MALARFDDVVVDADAGPSGVVLVYRLTAPRVVKGDRVPRRPRRDSEATARGGAGAIRQVAPRRSGRGNRRHAGVAPARPGLPEGHRARAGGGPRHARAVAAGVRRQRRSARGRGQGGGGGGARRQCRRGAPGRGHPDGRALRPRRARGRRDAIRGGTAASRVSRGEDGTGSRVRRRSRPRRRRPADEPRAPCLDRVSRRRAAREAPGADSRQADRGRARRGRARERAAQHRGRAALARVPRRGGALPARTGGRGPGPDRLHRHTRARSTRWRAST